jgi:drug/metabolite transporter (DMT)-like permease
MNTESRNGQIFILIFLAFIWGTSFILMKRGLEVFTANQVAAMRLFISFIVLLPFAIKRLQKFSLKMWIFIAMAGFLGSGIPAFMFTIAQQHINSSMAGILNALTPLFTLIIAVSFFRTKVYWYNVLGIILGFLGASALVIKDYSSLFNGENVYGLLIVFATFLYGYNTNHVKHLLPGLNGLTITALAFFTIGPFAGIYLLFSGIEVPMSNPKAWEAIGYIAILAVVGTAFALVIWNTLIKKLTAIYASSVTYIIPVFAIMWGVIDGESFSFREIISIALIFAGIYLVNKNSLIKTNEP